MKVLVDDSAKVYLEKNSKNEVTVLVKGCSAWGPSEPQPLVLMGEPQEDIDDYDVYEDNGIKVNVRVDVQAKDDELKISYKKLFFSGNLVVEGIEY